MQIRQYLIKLNQCITPFTKIKMSWFCTGKTNEELVNNLRGMSVFFFDNVIFKNVTFIYFC